MVPFIKHAVTAPLMMLAENISWIVLARDVKEVDHPRCNGLMNMVEGEHGVSLVKLSMDLHGAVDNRLVVTKHVTLLTNRETQVLESIAQINDLLKTDACLIHK